MSNLIEIEDPRVALAIKRFLPEAIDEDLDDPDGAWGQCTESSDSFLHFLDEAGVEGAVIEHFDPCVRQDRVDYPFGDLIGCSFHWAVRVGDIVIDWTARQFSDDAPFPAIWKCERREWRNVDE